ncbi:energy transducer TonB [Novosphingobium album (ex Hu et al. 2023)]|uniref:Energy transducer TonB n=1 Tax=Novosphingobium album (ex Hu et al. 2023) TaxID=2930093 RepID=A0ABT0B4L9_9SPHN|nr:energy transducer TonB [Novosphingobium album (ex Hu et al. 2023)]MCJ2179823.1 energy transducer TonB [Novosphingobium album (ex Hu et al. 2023)]
MKKLLSALLGIGLLQTSFPAHAETKTYTLPPASKWAVDWGQDSCTLIRDFGTKEHRFLLGMRSYAPGYRFEMTLAGKEATPLRGSSALTIAFGDGTPVPIRRKQIGTSDLYGPAVIFSARVADWDAGDSGAGDISYKPGPDPDMEKRINRITVESPSTKLVLQTGPMSAAMDAVRQCTDDLARQLGLDPSSLQGIARPVSPINQIAWVLDIQSLFPQELIAQRKDARVELRVVVDAKGTPARCDAFPSFGNVDVKDRACSIIMHLAKFKPALDNAGNPTAAIYSNTVLYKN